MFKRFPAPRRMPAAGIALAALLLLQVYGAVAAPAYAYDYLYVNASEGTASGGHAAIRFGSNVYHFQYDEPGFLKAVRESDENFRLRYNGIENRTIHVSRFEVPEDAYRRLEAQFERRYLLQTEQFVQYEALQRDRRLLTDILSAGEEAAIFHPVVKGAGLFPSPDSRQPENAATALSALKEKIEAFLGTAVFAERKTSLGNTLLRLQPEDYNPSKIDANLGAVPARYSFAERYADLAAAWLALSLLESGRAPLDSAFIEPAGGIFHLDPHASAALSRFQENLQAGLLRLMQSRRPDWGYAMLIGMARLTAVEKSLQSGRLIVLNTFPDDSAPITEGFPADAEFLKALASRSEARFQSALKGFTVDPNERSYSVLELGANLAHEIRAARLQKRPLRLHPGNLAPIIGAPIALDVQPQNDRIAWTRKLAELQAYGNAYAERLKGLYRYDLLRRNCVTEIFANIATALPSNAMPKKLESDRNAGALIFGSPLQSGGYMGWEGLNAIPFFSSWAVEHTYRLGGAWDIPSYRRMRLENAYRQENGLKVYLRESNIFTSTFYRWHSGDSAFLFFTDDSVWPRPVYGAVNVLAGAGQSAAGIFTLPFDGGETLLSGFRGFLISLPELLFINIRKGSFPALITIEKQ
jgi:hypothetical protein